MISVELADILRSNRTDFNARFNEARRSYSGLNGEQFAVVLREMVDPLIVAVAELCPDCVAETTSVAYDVALELAGQNLVGPGGRNMAIDEGWRALLPSVARHLAAEPRRVLPAISNALHHLATTPGARPAEWARDLGRLAGLCGSADEFLRLGQAAAWRSGLAHYRTAALALFDSLPEQLSLALLEVSSPTSWKAVRLLLEQNRWYNPTTPECDQAVAGDQLRIVARVGAFRGFGGLFIEPPRVAVNGSSILVRSGPECWLLTADFFGATFHRCDPALFDASARQANLPPGLKIDGSTVRRNGITLNLDPLGMISSCAATVDTLALTSPLTHAVLLVALT
ncbi:MAG: hypothetical protein A2X82_17030 [Geobacteraceae bacterium GWC2_55_20]|nr:MAG: hypothetical protein A2X82_17030 [Geobacteraceae bacterium GWC2_55_20]HCE67999.1 hypothetical protein [Geobacter sp.]